MSVILKYVFGLFSLNVVSLLLLQIRDQVIENYEQRKTKPDMGALCDADYQSLKNWRWDSNVTGDYNEFLTVQGWNDLKFMAKHYQRILPNVLENIYTPEKFLVCRNPVLSSDLLVLIIVIVL